MGDVPKKLVSCFPKSISNYIAQAGLYAYQFSYEFLNDYGLLITQRGKELMPHVRNALYDLKVMELVRMGEIPFTVEERENVAQNCYHALFIGTDCKFSISHVRCPGQFPRDAIFRGNYASNNIAISLFPEDEAQVDNTMAYAILTHGGFNNVMQFVRLGFPCNGERKWAGNQLMVFDRRAIVEVTQENAKSILATKPQWKKVKERLGDALK